MLTWSLESWSGTILPTPRGLEIYESWGGTMLPTPRGLEICESWGGKILPTPRGLEIDGWFRLLVMGWYDVTYSSGTRDLIVMGYRY